MRPRPRRGRRRARGHPHRGSLGCRNRGECGHFIPGRTEAVDFRKGIDSLAELCRAKLDADPFSGCLFVFRSRRATSIKVLVYDGQGFWLATKRLSKGRFRWWPQGEEPTRALRVHQAQVLLAAGNPDVDAAPVWRKV